MEKESPSLPSIDVHMSWLPKRCSHFALMDLLSGFDLLKVAEDSKQFFNISTIFGTHDLLAAPMGYTNTPSQFQCRVINDVLGGVSSSSLFGRK